MAVFSYGDFDQHEKVVFGYDPATGLKAIIAIHNTHLGPALGGCRMYPYQSEEAALSDVLRLSRGMTYKSALANLPLGGGKSVIIGDPAKDKSSQLFQEMGRFVNSLSGSYIVAQDSGTSVEDLMSIASETEHVAGTHEAKDDRGNVRSGDPSPATAYGVFVGIKSAVRHRLKSNDLSGVKVAIQGVGNVGFGVAKHLHAEGVKLFVSDVNEASVARAVKECDAQAVVGDDIYSQDVDVFAPCALGGAINDRTIDLLKVSIIAGAANNQLAQPEHARVLHDRGILYAPDFVLNAGGIIHVHYMRSHRLWKESSRHVERISVTLDEIFKRSEAGNKTPAVIADQMAEERFKPVITAKAEIKAGEKIYA
jgi:leucine dehydrogenase